MLQPKVWVVETDGEIAEAYESWVLIQDKATLKNKEQQQQQKKTVQLSSQYLSKAYYQSKASGMRSIAFV